MRPFRMGVGVTLLVTACAHAPAPVRAPSASAPTPHPTTVTPANIKRISRELPPGYEITNVIPSAASPRAIWSLDVAATVQPAECAIMADPGSSGNGRSQSAQGVSGSGAGGIVNAVVVVVPSGPVLPAEHVVAGCTQWTMSDGHTTAAIRLIDPPRIEDAETLGMITDIRTSVESGTEISSQIYTFIAYLGQQHYAFTTLTTDPGSMRAPLPAQFAADLLVKTVSTLRS
ncbi:hypothetical protein F0Q45_03830 [Mycobacterium simiae]|uniref:DUF5642 domain-containing protein n=1 Tax=Mycobacterium simiae TaxID=1784 RepID=A0A5B1BRW9_MYCSI|nr:DUF5642 family protein [Mycobacterium simiae]KAA1251568.1 hypothetical protein F0Q45_03830 [Mycobacterium simiae]